MANNATDDLFDQSITFQTHEGPLNVTIPDINEFVLYYTEICINYGVQVGASIVLLVALLLLTKPEKRRSSIFLVNTTTLALNIVRTVLHCVYFTGPFSDVYAYFSQDYSRIPRSATATSVTTTVFEVLVLTLVEISLCLQVRVVCVTLRDAYQHVILAFSCLIGLTAIGFRMAYMVENSIAIVNFESETPLLWLGKVSTVVTATSICWFCVVFVTKLGFALHQRRKLGLGQFGPMQIILIMGCHTLIIPMIFAILQFVVTTPAMNSNVLTAVAIFLPLSSLWASASIDTRLQASKSGNVRRGITYGSGSGTSGIGKSAGVGKGASGARSYSNATTSSGMALSPLTFTSSDGNSFAKDLEAQGVGQAT